MDLLGNITIIKHYSQQPLWVIPCIRNKWAAITKIATQNNSQKGGLVTLFSKQWQKLLHLCKWTHNSDGKMDFYEKLLVFPKAFVKQNSKHCPEVVVF